MGVPNPFTNPEAWSNVQFVGNAGTVNVPGVIRSINGHDAKEFWLVQKPQDSSFAVTIWRGRLLNENIEIELTIDSAEAFDLYQAAQAKLQPKPPAAGGFSNQPTWYVKNAALNFGGITRVGIVSMGTPRILPTLFEDAKIQLIQYRPFIVSKVGPPDPPKQETENDRKAKQLQSLIDKAVTL